MSRGHRRPVTEQPRTPARAAPPAAGPGSVPRRCRWRHGRRPTSNPVPIRSYCSAPLLAPVRTACGRHGRRGLCTDGRGRAAAATAANTNQRRPAEALDGGGEPAPAFPIPDSPGSPRPPGRIHGVQRSWGPNSALFDELALPTNPNRKGSPRSLGARSSRCRIGGSHHRSSAPTGLVRYDHRCAVAFFDDR